jgi:acyl carrier protein
MHQHELADRIEQFVRERFAVEPTDARFGRGTDLFEHAYVDSIGLAELLVFIQTELGVEVSDDELLTDEFASIDGIARIVARHA